MSKTSVNTLCPLPQILSLLCLFSGGLSFAQENKYATPKSDSAYFPCNRDESKVPAYTLPDPLVCFDGTLVDSTITWREKRRPEILETFTTEIFGHTPKNLPAPTFEVIASDPTALNGLATRKLVKIYALGKTDGPIFNLLLYVPNAAQGPAPAFLGLNFVGNQCLSADSGVPLSQSWFPEHYADQPGSHMASEKKTRALQARRWPLELILKRGYAVATIYYGDIEPDFPQGWKLGIRGAIASQNPDASTNPDKPFADDAWGAVAAWAWGLSRGLDYLATDPQIDATRVAVHGHSRLGKAALWAGASDERFALVISNCSGKGGASLLRRDFGERISQSNSVDPHRFTTNYRRYNENASALPVDAHMLIALVAPRPVYIASATRDWLADHQGEFLAAKHASPVYQLFGFTGLPSDLETPTPDTPYGDRIGHHIRTGEHDILASDWENYLNFADRHLPPPPGG